MAVKTSIPSLFLEFLNQLGPCTHHCLILQPDWSNFFFFQSCLLHSSHWAYKGEGSFQKAGIYLNYHTSKVRKEHSVALILFTSAKNFCPEDFSACFYVHRWQVSILGHSLADMGISDILVDIKHKMGETENILKLESVYGAHTSIYAQITHLSFPYKMCIYLQTVCLHSFPDKIHLQTLFVCSSKSHKTVTHKQC